MSKNIKSRNTNYKCIRVDLDPKDTNTPDSPRRKMKEKNIRNLVKRSFNYSNETQSFFKEKSVRNSQTSPLSVRVMTEGDAQENLYTVTETERMDTYAHTYGSFLIGSPGVDRFTSPKIDKHGSFKGSFLTKSPKGLNFALVLSDKSLSGFPKSKLVDFQLIQILDLSNNKFKEIPLELKKFETLKVLKLDNNTLKELPEDFFFWFNQLENFSVSNNGLEKFPESLGECHKTLRTLNISENQIIEFPMALLSLESLKNLSISKNSFSSIPKSLFHNLKMRLEMLCLEWFKYLIPSRDTNLKGPNLKAFLSEAEESQVPDQINFCEFLKLFSNNDCNSLLEDRNSKKRTLLHQVASDEDVGALRAVLTKNPNLINFLDKDNHTALSLAIYEEKYFCAKILIFNGADSNIGGGIVGGCLAMGVLKLQYYLVRDLLKFGADPNKRDKDGNTALHYLFSIFNRESKQGMKILEILMENGTNPNIKNDEGWYPIHVAVRRNNLEVLNWICSYNKRLKGIERGEKLSFDLARKGGRLAQTPLHIASQAGYKDMAQLLINEGVPCDQENLEGKTPKMVCSKNLFLMKVLRAEEMRAMKKELLEKIDKFEKSDKSETRYDSKTKVYSDEADEDFAEEMEDVNENFESLSDKMKSDVFTVTGGDKGKERQAKFFNAVEEKLFIKKVKRIAFEQQDSDSEEALDGIEEDEVSRVTFSQTLSMSRNGNIVKFEPKKKKIAAKNLHITPNNIKKIDRFQHYYSNLTRVANNNPALALNSKEKDNEKKIAKSAKLAGISTSVLVNNSFCLDLPSFYKKILKNVLRVKARTLELKEVIKNSKASDGTLIDHFNFLNKMHLKLIHYKCEAFFRKLSPKIFNTNIFESLTQQSFEAHIHNEYNPSENNLYIVLQTLLDLFQHIPDDDYITLNVKNLIIHLLAINKYFPAGTKLSEILEKPSMPTFLRYEAYQSLSSIKPVKKQKAN